MNFRRWFSRKDRDENMNDELRFYIEQQTAAHAVARLALFGVNVILIPPRGAR